MSEVPDGWSSLRLSDVAPIDTQQVLPAEQPDANFNYIALENIESGSGKLIGVHPVLGQTIKSNKFGFTTDHVLFGKLRPYLNKVVVPDRLGICSTDILPLRPRVDLITREFLSLALRNPEFVEFSRTRMEGTKMPRLRTLDLEAYEIPVPPLAEQGRIVARIEALTRRLEEARQARQAAVAEVERLVAAAMNEAFEARADFLESTLADVCTMKTGKTPPTSHPAYFSGDLPFVCPADVGSTLRISTAERRLSPSAVADGKANLFPPGTVLVVAIGSTTGKIGLAASPLCTNQQITGLTFANEIVPDYAAWFLTSQRSVIRGAASDGGVPIINQKGLGALPFRYPPDHTEQRRIVARLDALRAKVDELQRLQREVEAELAAFTPALLAKAFRGEL